MDEKIKSIKSQERKVYKDERKYPSMGNNTPNTINIGNGNIPSDIRLSPVAFFFTCWTTNR